MASQRRLLLSRRNGLLVRVVDDEVFLLDPGLRRIHHLNRVSLAIWRLLDQPHDVRTIVRLLAVAFPNIAVTDIRRDVRLFVGVLVKEGLVKRRAALATTKKKRR